MPDLEHDRADLVVAVDACKGRIDASVLNQVRAVIDRVDRRLALSRDVTVIAIAGATGSGKSSLFNALTRTALAEPGIHRPMTQTAMAVTFGDTDTSDLLDWLHISRRHTMVGRDLDGIVLIDMVDNDSVAVSHQQEVDRLLEVVDEFLWVVDPQKYADAVLHEKYVRPLASHGEVMTFVLNQIDRLPEEQVGQIYHDFVRLLHEDGIANPTIYQASALNGAGIGVLRHHMGDVAASKQSMIRRREADIIVQARALSERIGSTPAGVLGKSHVTTIANACMEVAGAKQIGEAVQAGITRRGRVATGWPWLGWLTRMRSDPLKRLHLDKYTSHPSSFDVPELTRASAVVHPVARARIDTALRVIGDDATARLPHGWRAVMDRLVKSQAATLPDVIDRAVMSTDLGLGEGHGWWKGVRAVQWTIFALTIVGLLWLAANLVMTFFLAMPGLPMMRIGALPLPTWLIIVCVVVGILLAVFSRVGVVVGAKATSARAVARLRRAMEAVAADTVITPINEELGRHDSAQEALARILK